MKKIIFWVSIIIGIAIAFYPLSAQGRKSMRNVKPNSNNVIENNNNTQDSVIADREVEFDLEKLSRLATINAHSNAKTASIPNGLVVLEITIDSFGVAKNIIMRENTHKDLIPMAANAVRDYTKRYKVKPAIKDGKPIEQSGIFLPIVFDASMFKQQDVNGRDN